MYTVTNGCGCGKPKQTTVVKPVAPPKPNS